jgi:diadenosine tetraphosphatase ApaH/serine/threonine PP2A family protein phosphatase
MAGVTRTLLFADVHANLPALRAVLAKGRELGVDSYLSLGDAVGYGPHPGEVIDLLAGLPGCVVLQGNHDYAVATGDTEGMNPLAVACVEWTRSVLSRGDMDWLSSLPVERSEGEWMAVHGSPDDPTRFNEYIHETSYRAHLTTVEMARKTVCFFGHTHVPWFYRRTGARDETIRRPYRERVVPGSHHLVNPGSVGQPRDGIPTASFAVWDREAAEVTFHRVAYPREQTIAALKKAGLPFDLMYRLDLGR